jgi:hypothetical protein
MRDYCPANSLQSNSLYSEASQKRSGAAQMRSRSDTDAHGIGPKANGLKLRPLKSICVHLRPSEAKNEIFPKVPGTSRDWVFRNS